jgi:hypothetical protein
MWPLDTEKFSKPAAIYNISNFIDYNQRKPQPDPTTIKRMMTYSETYGQY